MCQLHAYSDHKYLILLSRILINGCLQKFLSLIIPTKLPCQTMSKRERWLSSFHASCLLLPSHCPPPFSFFFFLNSPLHKNIVLLAIDKALLLNNSTAICSQHSPLLLCLCCDVISHENKLNCWNFPDHTIFLSFLHISLHFLCTCQETIVNFAKRCGQIIDLAIKWAPDETKAILEVHTYLGPAD